MAVCVFSDYFTVKNCLENKKTPWSLSSLSGKFPVFSHHYDVISCRRNLGNLNMESVGALSSQQGGEQIAGEWGAILPFPSVAVTYNYGGTGEPSRAKCVNFVWKRTAFKMTRWGHNSIKSERSLCNVCVALKTHSSFFPTSSIDFTVDCSSKFISACSLVPGRLAWVFMILIYWDLQRTVPKRENVQPVAHDVRGGRITSLNAQHLQRWGNAFLCTRCLLKWPVSVD